MPAKNIAILGATSHIAKGLIYNFSRGGGNTLFLFARSHDRVKTFLKCVDRKDNIHLKEFHELNHDSYDVLINCVGVGSPVKLANTVSQIIPLTETFDNLILEYLKGRPDALYVNFSSGAAYGTDFSSPAIETTSAKWHINNITPEEYYGIAKLYSETKHRAQKDFRIVDLRIFGYFSRFIDLDANFLLTEILTCVKSGGHFETSPMNITRDYLHPQDLFSLVNTCINKAMINDAYDAYSIKPATKMEILDYFSREYGLKYTIHDKQVTPGPTGFKDNYYSLNKKAESLGYFPKFTSMDTISQEAKNILNQI